jgi:hypothetical protein
MELHLKSLDDFSELLYDMEEEYLRSKKIAIRHIATYDDVTFHAIKPFIEKLEVQIRKATSYYARLYYISRHKNCYDGSSDFSGKRSSDFQSWHDYEIYIAWYGTSFA